MTKMYMDYPACTKCKKEFRGSTLVWQHKLTGKWICTSCWEGLASIHKAKYVDGLFSWSILY